MLQLVLDHLDFEFEVSIYYQTEILRTENWLWKLRSRCRPPILLSRQATPPPNSLLPAGPTYQRILLKFQPQSFLVLAQMLANQQAQLLAQHLAQQPAQQLTHYLAKQMSQ